MAFQTLKTDYVDAEFSGKKKYEMTENSDGTISLTDRTEYSVVGDFFGGADINLTNDTINKIGQAFDNGCATIANGISAKGVPTSPTATPAQMVTNINTVASNYHASGKAEGIAQETAVYNAAIAQIAQAVTNNGVSTAQNASPSTIASNISSIRSPNRGSASRTINPGASTSFSAGYYSGVTVNANKANLGLAFRRYTGFTPSANNKFTLLLSDVRDHDPMVCLAAVGVTMSNYNNATISGVQTPHSYSPSMKSSSEYFFSSDSIHLVGRGSNPNNSYVELNLTMWCILKKDSSNNIYLLVEFAGVPSSSINSLTINYADIVLLNDYYKYAT